MDSTTLKSDTIVSDGVGASEFGVREIKLTGDETRHLSEQIQAVNFRMRISPAGYNSDYHVAGDPTLLVILKGQLLLMLRLFVRVYRLSKICWKTKKIKTY